MSVRVTQGRMFGGPIAWELQPEIRTDHPPLVNFFVNPFSILFTQLDKKSINSNPKDLPGTVFHQFVPLTVSTPYHNQNNM